MGLTYPSRDPKRRIDRSSVGSDLLQAVSGVYAVEVGQSDHLGLILHIRPEEEL